MTETNSIKTLIYNIKTIESEKKRKIKRNLKSNIQSNQVNATHC